MITRKNLSHGMQRMILAVIALVLLPLTVFGENESDQEKYYYDSYEVATVNNPDAKDRLHLRTKAYGSAKSMGKYYNGTIVVLLPDNQKDAEWSHVRIGDIEGYMESRYLAFGDEAAQVESAQPEVTIENQTGKGLNLRSGQSIDSDVICLLENGTQATVLGVLENWLHVQVGYDTGYIRITGTNPRVPYTYGTPSAGSGQARITANCSAFAEPTADARIVCNLFVDEVFPLRRIQNGYAQIEVDGSAVWVKMNNIERIGEKQ